MTSDTVFYVYAVVRPAKPGHWLLDELPSLPVSGILPGLKVTAVGYRDLAAVASEAPASELGKDALEALLQDMEWVKQAVVAHQGVLGSLLDAFTVVPFKFCTVCNGRDKVIALLAENYDGFHRALDQLAGATEWGVKVYSKADALKAGIAANSPALEPQRRAVSRASAGAAYMFRRKLEMAAEKEAESFSDRCAQATHDRLSACSKRSAAGALQTSDIQAHAGIAMVLNGSYLVADDARAGFDAALEMLKAEYGAYGFLFEMSGPWPPYSFASLDVRP